MILRAVGAYKDTFDATTGKITRRVGVKVLTGTENTINTYNMLQITAILNPAREKGAGWQKRGLCTHAVAGTATTSSRLVEIDATATYFGGDFGFTAASGKQWLRDQYAAGTPVTLYYPLAEPVEEDWDGGATYCETPIKIATNLYNSAKFQNVIDALDTAVSTINNIVAGTIAQANSISELASGKQTRPNPADSSDTTCPTSCPNYRQCLLVEKDDGTPCWYPINDPWYDFTKPILATQTNAASTSYTQGYQQLEYIESSGTQYIDTGVAGGVDTLEIGSQFSFSSFVAYAGIFGNWIDDNHTSIRLILGNTDNGMGYAGFETKSTGTISNLTKQTIHNVVLRRSNVTIDETSTTLPAPETPTNTGNIALFNRSVTNPHEVRNIGLKVYSFYIKNNGVLVRDFVPVIQQSTGKYGMYDKVNGVFYPNAAASGNDFTPGPIVENDAGVPRGLWSATWANNSTTGVVGGTASGNARCANVAGSNGAVATAAQLASSAWNTHGRYCWCNLASITIDNAVTPIANGKWVKADAAGAGAYACEMNCSKNYCKSFVATTANLTNLFTTY